MTIVSNKIFGFVSIEYPITISGYKIGSNLYQRSSGNWVINELVGKFIFSYKTGNRALGSWSIVLSNDLTTVTTDVALSKQSDTIEIYDSKSATRVFIQSAHGLKNDDNVDILHIDEYKGTFSIKNVQPASFDIEFPFMSYLISDEPAWQLTRERSVIVNTAGETIDTLRQAVNQISNDVGNKLELNIGISDRRDIVKAINSIKEELTDDMLKNLILAISLN